MSLFFNSYNLLFSLRLTTRRNSRGSGGHLTPSIDIVQRMMKVFAVSADQLLNDNQNSVVEIQNHELNEQLALISQLDEDEKNALVKIINSMLTKKRMKDLLDGKINLNQ